MVRLTMCSTEYLVIVVVVFGLDFVTAAELLRCPDTQVTFEKVIGARPSNVDPHSVLYSMAPAGGKSQGVTGSCHQACAMDRRCNSFLVMYGSRDPNSNVQCYGYAGEPSDERFTPDVKAAFFRKICLSVPDICKTKYWSLERIQGSALIGYSDKVLKDNLSRVDCAQACVNERSFRCRSATFLLARPPLDPNMAMDDPADTGYDGIGRQPSGFGQCVLSREDKYTQSEAFRVASYGMEYLENQCVDMVPPTDDFCSFEEYANSSFPLVDVEYNGIPRKQCQNKCDNEVHFICRGYSWSVKGGHCSLHSTDTLALGPRLVQLDQGSVYMRRVKCLNLSVTCLNGLMVVRYHPSGSFGGRMYTSGHAESCGVEAAQDGGDTVLAIPLPGWNKGTGEQDTCGITEARSSGERGTRTLLSVLMVIQNNPIIQTQGDRLVKVGCVLNAAGTGDSPDDITLGSSLSFNATNQMPNLGSVIINSSTAMPSVRMYLLDNDQHVQTKDAQLGQTLELRIEVSPADGPYDIHASHLVARSEDGRASILLLDSRGCPVDPLVFPHLTAVRTKDTRGLSGRFQAFKFTGYPVVEFSVEVNFCMIQCPPVDCGNGVESFGRRRRSYLPAYNTNSAPVNSTNVTDALVALVVNMNSTNKMQPRMKKEMQLRLIVYEPGTSSQIIVAGIVDSNSLVCMDQVLVICLLVAWLLVQAVLLAGCIVTIRRYKRYADIEYDRHSLNHIHENLGFGFHPNLSRRVTWADQDGLTIVDHPAHQRLSDNHFYHGDRHTST